MKIKVFIPTYDRVETMTTYQLFSNNDLWEVYMVLSNDTKLKEYTERYPELNFYVSNKITGFSGFTYNKEYALENTENNEWLLYIGDNVKSFIDSNSNEISEVKLYEMIKDTIAISELNKVTVAGFACVDNPFFRKTKYDIGSYFLWGKAHLIKNTEWIRSEIKRLADKTSVKEDWGITLEAIARNGKVVRNNNIFPKAKMYTKGGIGKKTDREVENEKVINYILDYYKGIVIKNTKRDGELLIKRIDENTLNKIRLKMVIEKKLPKAVAIDILGKHGNEFIEKYIK